MLPPLYFLFRKTPRLQKRIHTPNTETEIVRIHVEIGPCNKLLAVWCVGEVVCSEDGSGPATEREIPAGPQPETERSGKFSTSTGYYVSISVRTLVSTFFPSPHLTLYGPPGRYDPSAPTRTWCEWTTHRRTWQPRCHCPLGGGGDGVVLRTPRWSGYSVCYGLEEWAKGKGEKGGEDLVKDEQTTASQSSNYTRTRRAQKISSQR